MGLGLEANAQLPSHGWMRRPPKTAAFFDDLEKAALACIDDPLLREHVYVTRDEGDADTDDGELSLWLHPGTEPVAFCLSGDRLTCSAATSPAGPGYHVYVVELLERLGERLRLQWEWSGADGEPGDECGYHETRDLESVQTEMQRWLRALCAHVVESKMEPCQVCLPLEDGPIHKAGIATPLGVFDGDWLREVAAGGERSWERGREFFSWWGRQCDGDFWLRYGKVIATSQLPWHPPESVDEARLYRTAIAAFERCRELAPRTLIPDLELKELRRLSQQGVGEASPPNAAGMGYRRGAWRWRLAGEWSVELPGYFYEEWDEGATVIWFPTRTCRFTTYRAEGSATKLLGEEKAHATVPPEHRVEWRKDHLTARATIHRESEDNSEYWRLTGTVATDGGLCVTTICFDDVTDREWAIAAFRSITRPSNESEDP